ncbi:hypothetical protein Slin15195_G005050 [Septoria linicola]|uniref:Uncharacterized protein n=1 Tax=Septoria linicola TaxID=215465 RepID=A0A9Q9ALV6_9PEZI|nr:hypothetical protein Slin15195_G005050 [Septoria linicola]
MQARPGLERCPNEIIECVVVLLELSDMCHLRLASRVLLGKATQDYFKSFCKHKHVDLTKTAIQILIDITQPGMLGCHIEELTLVGVVNNTLSFESIVRKRTKPVVEHNGPMTMSTEVRCTEDEVQRAQRDLQDLRQRQADDTSFIESGHAVELLSQAFKNLAENGCNIPLPNLKLDVVVFREDATTRLSALQGGGWKMIWSCASQTLKVTINALAQSRLPLNELDKYSEVLRCAVARDQLAHLPTSDPGLKESFKHLKALSISLSHRVIDATKQDQTGFADSAERVSYSNVPIYRDVDILRAEAAHEENFVGLANLLKVCEDSLERLDIHQYSLERRKLKQDDMHDEKIMQVMVQNTNLRSLTGAMLRGLWFNEVDLLAFLKQSRNLRQVVLQDMRMREGSWTGVFDMLTANSTEQKAAKMDFLLVDDLFEAGSLLYLDGEATGEPNANAGSNDGGEWVSEEGWRRHAEGGQVSLCSSQTTR